MVRPVDRINYPVTREHDPLARVRMQQFLEQLPRQVSTTSQHPVASAYEVDRRGKESPSFWDMLFRANKVRAENPNAKTNIMQHATSLGEDARIGSERDRLNRINAQILAANQSMEGFGEIDSGVQAAKDVERIRREDVERQILLNKSLAAQEAQSKAQEEALYGEGSLENVIDKRRQAEAKAKEFTSAMGVDRSDLPSQFTDDGQGRMWGGTYDEMQSQRQREAKAQARHKAHMFAMQDMGSGPVNKGYIPPQVEPGGGISYRAMPFLPTTYGEPVGQLPDGPPSYPALKLGADIAKQKNEEGKETNFIDGLLGDIDFKALAQNPIFQQIMGGLQRMPLNQGRFGDSMLTGFTRGVQQYDVAKSQEDAAQAAIDLEQERYDTEQERLAATAATAAEKEAYTRRKADRDFDWKVKKFNAETALKNIGSKLTESEIVVLADWLGEDPNLAQALEGMDSSTIKKVAIETASIFHNNPIGKGDIMISALEAIKRQRGGPPPSASDQSNKPPAVRITTGEKTSVSE